MRRVRAGRVARQRQLLFCSMQAKFAQIFAISYSGTIHWSQLWSYSMQRQMLVHTRPFVIFITRVIYFGFLRPPFIWIKRILFLFNILFIITWVDAIYSNLKYVCFTGTITFSQAILLIRTLFRAIWYFFKFDTLHFTASFAIELCLVLLFRLPQVWEGIHFLLANSKNVCKNNKYFELPVRRIPRSITPTSLTIKPNLNEQRNIV